MAQAGDLQQGATGQLRGGRPAHYLLKLGQGRGRVAEGLMDRALPKPSLARQVRPHLPVQGQRLGKPHFGTIDHRTLFPQQPQTLGLAEHGFVYGHPGLVGKRLIRGQIEPVRGQRLPVAALVKEQAHQPGLHPRPKGRPLGLLGRIAIHIQAGIDPVRCVGQQGLPHPRQLG